MSTFNDSILTHLASTWDTVLIETVENLRDDLVAKMKVHSNDNSEHPGWCSFTNSVEDKCDCIVSELIAIVRGDE